MAEYLSGKDARLATTETPWRRNPTSETARKNYRKVSRRSKRK